MRSGTPATLGTPALTLLVTSPRVAPGLLSRDAWRVLDAAAGTGAVLARDLEEPLAQAVTAAGLEVRAAGSASVDRLATELVALTSGGREVVWLGSADGDPGLSDALAVELSRQESPPEIEILVGSWDVPGGRLLDAVAVMDRLRSAGGCPWDRKQTHASLVPYLAEEAEEAAEAITALATPEGHVEDVCEELGDVLFQVLFHARVAEEGATPVAGEEATWPPFDIDDVAATLVAKLVRRHPHVFGDSTASTPEEVEAQWAEIKATERAEKAARRES